MKAFKNALKVFLFFLLYSGLALAQDKQVVIRVERGPGADSLLREAQRLEPRLGEYQVVNDERVTIGYKATNNDTLKVPALRALSGKLVSLDVILIGATGVRGGDLWIGYDGERLKPIQAAWGKDVAEFMTAAELTKAPGIMRLSFGAPGKPSLPDSVLLCTVQMWRTGDSPGRNMWGASATFTDKLAPKVVFRETPIEPEVRIEEVKGRD